MDDDKKRALFDELGVILHQGAQESLEELRESSEAWPVIAERNKVKTADKIIELVLKYTHPVLD